MLEAIAGYRYYHIYPDPQQERLRQALSRYVGVPARHIFVGNGADEILDLLSQLFLEPGDTVVNLPPTFGMYEFDASMRGAHVVEVWRDPETFAVDPREVESAVENASPPPKLLFLATPNNPDGSVTPPEVVERLLALPLVVVVDEAYHEFSGGKSFAPRVPERENLVVLRTFSKWAGLAGLRLGYAILPEPIVDALWKIKQPYNVNVAAAVAGIAALGDEDHARRTISAIVSERERLLEELRSIPGLSPLPSRTNFILCRVDGMEARKLRDILAEEGVMVRYYDKPGLRNALRITVGRPEQNALLLEVLRQKLAPSSPAHDDGTPAE